MTSDHLSKLCKYSQETEMRSYVDQRGTLRQYRQSTERALLAQRKIFLRKKLGEGSFSSVREGFDMFHQYKIAIKVSDVVLVRSPSTHRLDRRYTTSFERLPREVSPSRIGYLATCSTREYHQNVRSFCRMRQNLYGNFFGVCLLIPMGWPRYWNSLRKVIFSHTSNGSGRFQNKSASCGRINYVMLWNICMN